MVHTLTEDAPPRETSNRPAAAELTDIGEESSGDRISVTDVNGTVAKFDMSYSPPLSGNDRLRFGPPMRMRIPGLLYLGFATAIVGVVLAAHFGSSNSALFRWVVMGDRGRPISSAALSVIILLSALGTVLRGHMRGVIVRADGLEARYVLALGMPQIKRWAWAQVHRIVVDDAHVMLELWDGRYERLPPVAEPKKLAALLEQIAGGRKIAVTRLSG